MKTGKIPYFIILVLLTGINLYSRAGNIFLTNGGAGTKTGLTWNTAMDFTTYFNSYYGKVIPAGTHIYIKKGSYTISFPATNWAYINSGDILIQGGFPATASGTSLTGYDPVNNTTLITLTGASWIGSNGAPGSTTYNAEVKGLEITATGPAIFFNANIYGGQATILNIKFTDIYAHDFILGTPVVLNGLSASATAKFSNCVFNGNTNRAIYSGVSSAIPVTIDHCSFSGNSDADSHSGGAVLSQGPTTVTNSYFCNNTESYVGGGAIGNDYYTYAALPTTYTISNTVFVSNTSGQGGAIYNYNGTVNIQNCTFYNNSSNTGSGGAICLWAAIGSSTVSNCTFYQNKSLWSFLSEDNGGGAIYVGRGWSGSMAISNCEFVKNYTVSDKAGAVYLDNTKGSSITISNSLFNGNYNNNNPANTTANGADVLIYDYYLGIGTMTLNTDALQLAQQSNYKNYLRGTTVGYNFGSGNTFGNLVDHVGSPTLPSCPTFISITTLAISGSVWNDANNNVTFDAGESGTNAGGPLYVNLVDATTGSVLQSVLVASNGTYSGLNAPLGGDNYVLVLSTSAGSTTPGPLPANWKNTGESVGSNTATQSAIKGQIELPNTGSGALTGQNFGIIQCTVAITATASPPLVCASTPSAVNLSSTPSGGIAPLSYLWTGSGVTNTTSQNTTANPTASGTYSVKVTDALGCTATGTTANVTYDNTTPSVVPICVSGSSFRLTEQNGVAWTWTTTSGGRFYPDATYSVDKDSDVSHLQSPYIITVGDYAVQITDANGCTSGFSFTVSKATCNVLASNMQSFTGRRQGNTVNLQWQVAPGNNVKTYVVERSTNGQSFTLITTVQGTSATTYNYADDVSAIGCIRLYYRIRQAFTDGNSSYSTTATINCNENDVSQYVLKAYPNPVVSGGMVTVQYSLPAGVSRAQLVISNMLGGRDYSYTLSNTTPNLVSTIAIPVNNNMPAGVYFIRIAGDKWLSKTIKVIKQ